MNLKKLSGTGTADYCAVAIQAWRDRAWIQREIKVIDPTVIVACGSETNRVLYWILHDDLYAEVADNQTWSAGTSTVVASNHPSVRPANAPAAVGRLVNRAKDAKVAAFS